MVTICPTITVPNAHVYREQMERIQDFTSRVHIDLMDGIFAPTISLPVEQIWWPEGMQADVHIMFQNPEVELSTLHRLRPNTVIVHAESDGDIASIIQSLHAANIKVGLAIFPETSVASVAQFIPDLDQILIFSGNLGHQGGSTANLDLLEKAAEIRAIKPSIEMAWDGGVNDENVAVIARAGIDVINVGGYIQHADKPAERYQKLVDQLGHI